MTQNLYDCDKIEGEVKSEKNRYPMCQRYLNWRLLNYIRNYKITEKSMLKFCEGIMKQVDVVAVYSGVCKVNAAVAAQLLIDVYHVDCIINGGTAGGMEESVQQLSIRLYRNV